MKRFVSALLVAMITPYCSALLADEEGKEVGKYQQEQEREAMTDMEEAEHEAIEEWEEAKREARMDWEEAERKAGKDRQRLLYAFPDASGFFLWSATGWPVRKQPRCLTKFLP